jgi:hypothetical protein
LSAPPTNETLTRALGGYEENRRVPSLLELQRKTALVIEHEATEHDEEE